MATMKPTNCISSLQQCQFCFQVKHRNIFRLFIKLIPAKDGFNKTYAQFYEINPVTWPNRFLGRTTWQNGFVTKQTEIGLSALYTKSKIQLISISATLIYLPFFLILTYPGEINKSTTLNLSYEKKEVDESPSIGTTCGHLYHNSVYVSAVQWAPRGFRT